MERETASRRQRSRRACQPCHQRKKKCDGEQPCSTCIGYGYECQYSAVQRTKPSHNTPTPGSSNKRIKPSPPEDHTDDAAEKPSRNVLEGVLEPSKSRFVGASSAIIFPINVARDLGSRDLLRLHSYAWNAGTRQEQPPPPGSGIESMLSRDQMETYSAIFFSEIHPVFGFIDQDVYEKRCDAHWSGDPQGPGFEAIASGVCALGSLFAGADYSAVEAKLVQHAKSILDSVGGPRATSCDFVAAGILHSLYLRSTTRPHASWVASCTTLHHAEAVGLHREYDTLLITSRSSNTVSTLSTKEKEVRRRTFWVAWLLNRLFSSEYGRTAVHLDHVTCAKPTDSSWSEQDYTGRLITLAKVVWSSSATTSDLDTGLDMLGSSPEQHLFLSLFEANIGLYVFRKLRLSDGGPSRAQVSKTLSVGRTALAAAQKLAAQNHVWWDILCVPFHYLCVLLAVNTPESLSLLAEAMATLEQVTGQLQTHMAQEAFQAAQSLVELSIKRKQQELELLSSQLRPLPFTPFDLSAQATIDSMVQEMPLSDWLHDGSANLDLFLESMPGYTQ